MAPQCHCCAAANVAIGTFNMHWIRRRHSTMHYKMHRHRHIGMPEHERIIDWHRAIVWYNAIQLVPSHTFVFMCVAETIPIDPRVLRINPGTAHNVIPLPKWITQPTSTRASYVHTIACDDASGKLLRTNRTHTQWHTASSSIRAPGMKVAVKFVFELGMGDFSGREEGARWFLFLVTHYSGPKVSILPNTYVLRSLWMGSERKKEMQTMNIWGPDEKRFLCLSLISTNDKQCYTLCVLDDWLFYCIWISSVCVMVLVLGWIWKKGNYCQQQVSLFLVVQFSHRRAAWDQAMQAARHCCLAVGLRVDNDIRSTNGDDARSPVRLLDIGELVVISLFVMYSPHWTIEPVQRFVHAKCKAIRQANGMQL